MDNFGKTLLKVGGCVLFVATISAYLGLGLATNTWTPEGYREFRQEKTRKSEMYEKAEKEFYGKKNPTIEEAVEVLVRKGLCKKLVEANNGHINLPALSIEEMNRLSENQ